MAWTTRTLAHGDNAPWFNLPNVAEDRVVLRDLAGKPLVLFFYGHDDYPACEALALAFNRLLPEFEAFGAAVYGISLDPPAKRQAFAEQHQLQIHLLSDEDERVSIQYGVLYPENPNTPEAKATYQRAAIVLDENLRVYRVYPLSEGAASVEAILRDFPDMFPPVEVRQVAMQAPVLFIPRVITPEFCRELIRVWHEEGNEDSGFMMRDGDKTIGVYDYNKKVRRDHFVREGPLRDQLDRIMRRRVFPEIQKAFQYECSRREDYKISCYESSTGGYFRAHRDNTTGGTAHRRFAMTLNLNVEEYEGGHLRFPEYGPHLYKPNTADALIFSGSIMHEATDVTAGTRFVLLAFFYGDAEAAERLAYAEQHGEKFEVIRTS